MDAKYIEQAIMEAIKIETQKIIEKETQIAYKNVVSEMKNLTDKIALNFLKYYEIQDARDRIIITVKKDI